MKKIFIGIIGLLIGALIGVGSMYIVFKPIRKSAEPLQGAFRLSSEPRTVLNAVTAADDGEAFNVADYQLIGFTVITDAVSGTVKFPCSMQDTAPSFASSSQSATNTWGYVDVTDLENETSIDGHTGLVFTGNSTTVRQVQIRNSGFKWCTASTMPSPLYGGTTTVNLLPVTAQ